MHVSVWSLVYHEHSTRRRIFYNFTKLLVTEIELKLSKSGLREVSRKLSIGGVDSSIE